uniref:Uncharacterized protein n=1 Tax=Arundo donax TaxID=35708 RepID=A0A0A9GKY4_ARUDO
MRDFAGILRD